jgi:hypothetical protein
MQPFIVGVRFTQIGKAYHFDGSTVSNIKVGDHVIVETSRGKQLGEVTVIDVNPSSTSGLPRRAICCCVAYGAKKRSRR